MLNKLKKNDNDQQTNNDGSQFLMVSLYLFILIFFVLLVNFAQDKPTANDKILQIFKSFQGEDAFLDNIFIVTKKEERILKAKSIYSYALRKTIDAQYIKLYKTSDNNFHKIFRVEYPLQKLLKFPSKEFNLEAKNLFNYIFSLENADPDYPLKTYFKFGSEDIFDIDNLEYIRAANLQNIILQNRANLINNQISFIYGDDEKLIIEFSI